MKECKQNRFRWTVLAAYMIIAALTQLFWINFASIDTYVEKLLNSSAMKVGMLTMIFPLTFLVLSVPAGIVIDRKGYKFSIMVGAIFTAFFALLRLIAPFSYPILFISQLGISLGQPFVLNSITKLAGLCFPEDEEATAVGLGSVALFIGMIVGMGLTPFLLNKFGFFFMLLVYAFISLLSVFFLYLIDKRIEENILGNESSFKMYLDGILNVLKIKDILILGFIAFISIGSFNGILTWLEKILNEMHKIPLEKAGTIASALIFRGMIGCYVIPELSDRTKKRKLFLIIGFSVAAFSLTIFAISQGNVVSDMIILSVMGFFAISTFPLLLTLSTEISGRKYAGFSTSFLQLLGNGAAVLIVPLINYLRNSFGNYKIPLLGISVLFLISILLSAILKEGTHSKINHS